MEERLILNWSHGMDAQTIKLCQGDIVFWVGGTAFHFPTLHAAEAMFRISEAHPRTIHAEELFEFLNAQVHTGDRRRFSQTVYKHVSQARGALAKAGVGRTLVQTVRNFGYRLGPGWSVQVIEEPAVLLRKDLAALRELLDRCITEAWRYPMITTGNGIMYLDADKGDIQSHFLQMDRLSRLMVKTLGERLALDACLHLKDDLDRMLSYVLFRRIGEGMSESRWRSLYAEELNALFHDLELWIQRIPDQR